MATQDKDFKVKNGLQVGGPTNLVNYSSASPSNPFIGQLWIDTEGELPEPEPDTYLSLIAASALYLSIIDAQNTYLPISASSNFGGGPSGEYDPIGSASAAEFNAKAYADSLSVNYDVIGSASAAEFNAKNYADSLSVNYDAIGSASAQRILAQEYADSLSINYDSIGSASAAEFDAKNYADSLANNYDSAGSASAAQTAAQNYADAQIFNLVDSAPETLNTLNELAAALGDDPNFATSTASALGQRLTIANASATYLTKVDASTIYLPISASSTLGGGAVVEMSPTEPPDPEDGTLWVDTDSDIDTLNVNDYLRKDSASSTYLTIAESANLGGGYARSFLLGGM